MSDSAGAGAFHDDAVGAPVLWECAHCVVGAVVDGAVGTGTFVWEVDLVDEGVGVFEDSVTAVDVDGVAVMFDVCSCFFEAVPGVVLFVVPVDGCYAVWE